MQNNSNNRITKSYQARRTRRADRLRALLQCHTEDVLLLDACRRKTAADVEAILTELPTLNPDNVRDSSLRTPLHIACARRDDYQEAAAIARILIKRGSDVNNGVGDMDGFQPMHMAVLAGNIHCVLLLLEQGASVPASDPFRLTPLLLAKRKMDNLRLSRLYSSSGNGSAHLFDDDKKTVKSSVALAEYRDLQSITKVLVTHLANKHITTHGFPSQHGLSDILFSKESEQQLNQTIANITDQLSGICMHDKRNSDPLLQDAMNNLMEKVRNMGIEETAVK
ncbi:hypothetical protein BX666DRAFT_509425 [Dichotomocladium elegans]|nr:hypothetical protein BX666DRAFT_509425 [Dichotomocladium elegans]